jgi:hypothetical protein
MRIPISLIEGLIIQVVSGIFCQDGNKGTHDSQANS